MYRIYLRRRHGLQVFHAIISTQHMHRESVFMSEQGARDWVARTLNQLVVASTAA